MQCPVCVHLLSALRLQPQLPTRCLGRARQRVHQKSSANRCLQPEYALEHVQVLQALRFSFLV